MWKEYEAEKKKNHRWKNEKMHTVKEDDEEEEEEAERKICHRHCWLLSTHR